MINSNLYMITGPGEEPLHVDDVKKHAIVQHTDDDKYIAGLIPAVRRQVEESECWIQLITSTWEIRFDEFPNNDTPIVLPRPPLQSLSTIIYTDADGNETTWVDLTVSPAVGAARVIVDTKTPEQVQRGEVHLAWEQEWPTDVRGDHNGVKVRFVAGFGADPEAVPENIRHWMLLTIASLYANRESETIEAGVSRHTLGHVAGLLDPYRAREFV